MRVSKEWIRRRNDDDSYSDLEMIFVGPYDPVRVCPNPEELDLNDGSFGSWLDGVLVRESLMALNSCYSDIDKVAYAGATAYESLISTGADVTSLRSAMESLQSGICKLDDTNSYCYYSTGADKNNIISQTYEIRSDDLYIDGKSLNEYLQTFTDTEKENKTMNFNFDFGPVDSSVHMSLYGMAIKNASGAYVAYDAKTGSIMDVDIINFEGANKFMYKMPVALSAVQVGDVIVHSKHPMFVSEVDIETNRMVAVDIYDGEEKVIVPTQSPFGFSFITKVVSLINFANSADASNPFGDMLPFLLMSDSKSNDNSMLMAMAMMCGHTGMMQNPMMLYALMNKDGKNSDILPLLLMSGFGAKPNGCSGNCSCHKDK